MSQDTHSERGQLNATRGWQRFLGFFVANKLVVAVLVLLLTGAGLMVSPFESGGSGLPRYRVPVDAIPDIGENQQIVFTKWPGRSPRDIEDQLTYPLTTALLGIPGVRTVRSSSMFGFSSISVIFEDDVEFYWSRSRVLEKLSSLPPGTVPGGVSPTLGPDATALGQVFWYTLEGRDASGQLVGGWDLHELRSVQDFRIRYALQGVRGVADVASVGGYVQEYQVDVEPEALLAFGVALDEVAAAVRNSNADIGARTLEINRAEYVVRSLGYLKSKSDIEDTVIRTRDHTPVRIRDVARVTLGPAERRGALDDAGSEVVGGVVIARYGDNPMEVIERVKAQIESIAPSLPARTLEDGTVSRVTIVPFYDRSQLIGETLDTLSTALFQQILVTIIVVLLMLRNLRTSLVVTSVLPLAVLGTFVAMKFSGVGANVMALAGIAIAIGTMVDMGIVFTENIAHRLRGARAGDDRGVLVARAAAEVAPAVLTSVLTTVVSFLPVFALTAAEGKLFSPLAFTKSFAMVAALVVSMLILPALAHLLLVRERAEQTQNLRVLLALRWREVAVIALGIFLIRWSPIGGAAAILVSAARIVREALPPARRRNVNWAENGLAVVSVAVLLALDWMPLGHGRSVAASLIFVVIAIGGLIGAFLLIERSYVSILRWALANKGKALAAPTLLVVLGLLSWLGAERVLGGNRLGSAMSETFPGLGKEFMPSLDEGSFLYMPTTMPHASFGQALEELRDLDARIAAIPEVTRAVGKLGRADTPLDPAPISMFEVMVSYSAEYGVNDDGERVRLWRDHIRSPDDIWREVTIAAGAPGLTSALMLMPMNTRLVMLQSGMRAPMGIKVKGPSLEAIERFGMELEKHLKTIPGVRADADFADRVVGKPYLEIDIDREEAGRYGLSIGDVQKVLEVALGGSVLTWTVEGRERYAVRVRYAREERDSLEALGRIFVPTPGGEQVPLELVASFRYAKGPQVIKSEDTFLTSYVLFDKEPDASEASVAEAARDHLASLEEEGRLVRPEGVVYEFAGS